MGWSLLDLEKRAGISKNTLVRFEGGGGVHHTTATKIEEVLLKEGLTFIYEDDIRGPGIVLSKELSRRLKHRPKATSKTKHPKPVKK